ncbi:MAG: hypothetical protein NT096_07330 [Proteobacteria bacterium]|nr:hypothetical protein [Pseudomonadota bacterium]
MMQNAELVLRLPFSLGPGKRLEGIENPVEFQFAGRACRLSRLNDELYVASVSPFLSDTEAKEFFVTARNGLVWASLQHHVALKVNPQFDEVTYAPDPEGAARNLGLAGSRVDGLVNADQPAIYPVGKHIRTIIAKGVGVVGGVQPQVFFSTVEEGIAMARDVNVLDDPRFSTSLDLYAAHHYEHSSAAKLLTLVMALEALTTPQPKASAAQELLELWQNELAEALCQIPADDLRSRESLEALQRELLFRREDSLRQRVRTLVRRTLAAAGHAKAEELAQLAVTVYDRRSMLSHEGQLAASELGDAIRDAKFIVEEVLRSRLVVGSNLETQ